MVDDKIQKRQLWAQKRQERLSARLGPDEADQIEGDDSFAAHNRLKAHLGIGQSKAFMRITFIGALFIAVLVFLF